MCTSRLLVAFLLLPAAAAASPPETDPVAASFGATSLGAPVSRTCAGADGEYVEINDTFEGDLVSSDPRLNGRMTVEADILANTTTGFGAGDGSWQIRDAAGNLMLTGRFKGTVSEFTSFKGFAWGELGTGETLFANIAVLLDPVTGSATGTVGSPLPGAGPDSAVILSGSCGGGFGPQN